MKKSINTLSLLLLIVLLLNSIFACGPSYLTPIFEYEHAPENPFENFAAGKLGIIKPTQRRIVLVAAYRYLNGGGFSQSDQKSLVDVWNAEFNNKSFEQDDISETVKNWVEKRKSVVGKEEKTPEIYVEREYGGYDFFPNCTKNAFETAMQTLSDRITSHGSDDKDVKDWVKAQDKVFENCASGKSTPDASNETMPEWLQKDRNYQVAAAEFYSLDYEDAKRRFAEITQDYNSPWQETAEYLVGRTLIRQASLSKDSSKSSLLYTEAEQRLSLVATKSGRFSDSAEKMIGLIKFRLRPQERVRELAQNIANQGGSNFRQDLIDYNWLLDKFEKESLEAEEKRKEETKPKSENSNSNTEANNEVTTPNNANTAIEPPHDEGDLKITVYMEDYSQNWSFYIKPEATDDEALAKAEAVIGKALTDKMKQQVRDARKEAYKGRFDGNTGGEYQGGYYGSEAISLSILPDYLRLDDLTNWLFTFQIQGNEAYLYALSQYRQTNSDLWLLTAISKANSTSTELNRLFEAADKIDRNAPSFATIAYHKARILMEQGKTAEARKLLDDILNSTLDLPISTRNQFLKQRIKLSETLDDFLKFAQLKPFAFDSDGESGTIDQFIAEQKSWYDPKNETKTREEYEKEIEENYAEEKVWQDRTMFDYDTIELMNQHFPLPVLLEAQKSPALPEYLRERFAIAIWTRAVLLDDFTTADKIAPQLIEPHPDLKDLMDKIFLAKTPVAKQRAAMYLILKNPMLTPYLEDGMGRTDNEFGNFDANDWWCAPYDTEYDETSQSDVSKKLPTRPMFLTATQSNAAQAERKKLGIIGDGPKFLGEKVLEWAKLSPTDKRVPESLYITWQANGWTKYGCGNNEELRNQISAILKKKISAKRIDFEGY